MRIAFISTLTSHVWGGSEELWSKTALALLAKGHEVAAYIDEICSNHSTVKEIEKAGGQIITRSVTRKTNLTTKLKQRLRAKKTEEELIKFHNFITKAKPSLACVSNALTMDRPDWVKILWQRNIPFVNLSQSNGEFLWPSDADAGLLRENSRKALRMCFVSEGNRKLFETQIAEILENAVVVKNPYNADFYTKYAWPKEENPTTLAFVGRLEPQSKGHDILIEVLAQDKWRNRSIIIECYGAGHSAESVKMLIEKNNLSEAILLKGYESDSSKIWDHCHALILPSRYEGLPLAIVEAMLACRPVITTNVAGNCEYLDDNTTGFIAESATASALDEAMERAWDKRLQWEAIGIAAGNAVRLEIPVDPPSIFAEELVRWGQRT